STVFFYQAEDGIRDFHVTGVQTCALPIYPQPVPDLHMAPDHIAPWRQYHLQNRLRITGEIALAVIDSQALLDIRIVWQMHAHRKIGRASWRDRVSGPGWSTAPERAPPARP